MGCLAARRGGSSRRRRRSVVVTTACRNPSGWYHQPVLVGGVVARDADPAACGATWLCGGSRRIGSGTCGGGDCAGAGRRRNREELGTFGSPPRSSPRPVPCQLQHRSASLARSQARLCSRHTGLLGRCLAASRPHAAAAGPTRHAAAPHGRRRGWRGCGRQAQGRWPASRLPARLGLGHPAHHAAGPWRLVRLPKGACVPPGQRYLLPGLPYCLTGREGGRERAGGKGRVWQEGWTGTLASMSAVARTGLGVCVGPGRGGEGGGMFPRALLVSRLCMAPGRPPAPAVSLTILTRVLAGRGGGCTPAPKR